MIGDLHCHTRFSDGSMSIDDLIFYAKRAGLEFVAVTDHDTMDGVTRAAILGKRYGISVIPGVEISCFDNIRERRVHMLCYFPEKPDRLQGLFSQILEGRTKTAKRMIRAVTRFYPVTEEHIQRYSAGSKSIYECHIIQALMDLGYGVSGSGELHRELFDPKTGLCYRERDYYPDVLTGIEAIKGAGGIAVIAHPMVYDSMELATELAEKGLIHGIEAYHPTLDASVSSSVLEPFAEKYGLIKTGGSDFHGSTGRKPCPLASRITCETDLNALFSLKSKLAKRRV